MTFSHKVFAKHFAKSFRGMKLYLAPLYLERNKQAIILYPYFICEWTESFLLQLFPWLWRIFNYSLFPELWYVALLLETKQISESIDFIFPKKIWANYCSVVYLHVILFRMYEGDTACKERFWYCVIDDTRACHYMKSVCIRSYSVRIRKNAV